MTERIASPALPEETIARIANLLAHGVARPSDAGDLRRVAEVVRALRARVGELEAVVDGREAERLIEAFAEEFGG